MALKILVIVFAVIIVVLFGVLFFYQPAKGPTVTPATSTISSSTLVSLDGTLSVDATSSLAENSFVTSPLVITGNVRGGGWFFEATFPVKILDGNGTVLGTSFAQAEIDWTSTGTVPFRSEITFSSPKSATGTLILMNDNPSGDPSKSKSLSIPVRFK